MNGIEWLVNPPNPQPIDLPTTRHSLDGEHKETKPRSITLEQVFDLLRRNPVKWSVQDIADEGKTSIRTAKIRADKLVEMGLVDRWTDHNGKRSRYRVRNAV